MKILIIGDLHLGAKNVNLNLFKMMNTYFQDELFPYILKNDIKTVICLGDLLDKRRTTETIIAQYLRTKFFSFFEKNEIHFYSIIGNHDIYYRHMISINSPSQFVDTNNQWIHIVSEPKEITVDNQVFCMIPWICEENKEEVVKWIETHSHSDKILLGHFELKGFLLHKGYYSESGSIEEENISSYRCVISGHYHSPSEKGNISYIGTPYELTWNDYGDEKKVLVFDTETNQFESVLTNIRLYKKIFYNDDIIKGFKFDNYKNTYIKVIITQEYDDIKFNTFIELLDEKAHPYSLNVIDTRDMKNQEEDEMSSVDVLDPIQIMLNMLETTVKQNQIEEAKKIVLNIHNQVINEE